MWRAGIGKQVTVDTRENNSTAKMYVAEGLLFVACFRDAPINYFERVLLVTRQAYVPLKK